MRITVFITSASASAVSGSRFIITQRLSRMVTLMAGPVPSRAKFQDLAHPSILLEWLSTWVSMTRFGRKRRTSASWPTSHDAPDRPPGDRGNSGLVEDAVAMLHELHIGPVPSCNFLYQCFVRESVFPAVRRPDVGRQRLPRRVLAADGLIEKQFGKPARRQPGERTAIGKTSKRQPPIAFDAVPADFRGIKPFPGHRFDRVTK